MIKIINGRKYSTETAFAVAERDNGLYPGDLYWYAEKLFRKRNGEFFLWCEGGAASCCAQQCGSNHYCAGERISPLTTQDAQAWVELHCDASIYEALWGPVNE